VPGRVHPTNLPDGVRLFLEERHLATLTTLRADGTPHVVAVGFTWDDDAQLARVITFAASQKVRNLERTGGGPAAVCQVDGGRWLTLEGHAIVSSEPGRVDEAVRRYANRYRQPADRDDRVVIEITVERVLGRA
jgi:F420H(2)-dependent biliverdin reductase